MNGDTPTAVTSGMGKECQASRCVVTYVQVQGAKSAEQGNGDPRREEKSDTPDESVCRLVIIL